jgi:hypothetical protein
MRGRTLSTSDTSDLGYFPRLRPGTPPPEGYEWLADVYKRDIAPLGADGLERARRKLAEGRVRAILRGRAGTRREIEARLWDRENIELVYGCIRDGWMRLKKDIEAPTNNESDYARGHIFVPAGEFTAEATKVAGSAAIKARLHSLTNWWKLQFVPKWKDTLSGPGDSEMVKEARRAGYGDIKALRDRLRDLKRDDPATPKEWRESGPRGPRKPREE